MGALFFYGTLRHVPLLECVLGRKASDVDIVADRLPGFSVRSSTPDGMHPTSIEVDDTAQTEGLLVRGLSTTDIARLTYYEAGFAFDLRPVDLTSGRTADVFFPVDGTPTDHARWDYHAWERRWAQMTVWAAEEVMAGFGSVKPEEIAQRFPRIRARAWSRVLAQNSRHGDGVLAGRVDVLMRRQAYHNFFSMDDFLVRHETYDGGMSETLSRAVFLSSDAAIVLPYDAARDRVLLVEQLRMGSVARYDPVRWQLEPIAGLIDPGETPEQTAHREGREEAGVAFRQLEPVGACYASPGATTDFYHMFVGLCDLPDNAAGLGGEAGEGEYIKSHLMSYTDLMEMVDDRRASNIPLAMLAYWLARHRDRLRAAT